MSKVIPPELRNRRGLRKLKEYYEEQLTEVNGNVDAPVLIQLRSDIHTIEQELGGKPLAVSAVASRK
jgi:hypothetical protein